jgi:hypothetical protein
MKGRSVLWTDEETQTAVRLKADGMGVPQIARVLGRTAAALHCRFKFIALSPEQKAARYKKYHVKANERRRMEPKHSSGLHLRYIHRPSAEQVAERDERFSKPRSFAQLYLGDPLPGQSALDKRSMESRHGTN